MKDRCFAIGFKLSAFVALLATTGCAEYNRRVLEGMDARGPEFTRELAKEYGDLGTTEENIMYDECSANYYFQKAILAKQGYCVGPSNLARYTIDEEKLPEIVEARARLVSALQRGARELAPQMTAHTQAHFDCWVEQQAEGWQTDDIAVCRAEFLKSLAEVEKALP
jgi:OOP family OmpA-OmpF porin